MTLPKEVRDTLGLGPGDRVRLTVTEDGRAVLQPETIDVLSLFGRLKARKGRHVTVEQMNAAIRARAGRAR
jgi:AbrB family looped-hinge helix DNA binding protein